MRICLLTRDGYPYRRDTLGDWCHTLVSGLVGHTFEVVALVDGRLADATAYPAVRNVTATRARRTVRRREPAGSAGTDAAKLCDGLLAERAYAPRTFAAGLRGLAAADGDPLAGVPLAELLVDAWRSSRTAAAVDRLPLPRLSVRDARSAAQRLRHLLGTLVVRLPAVDLVHCVGGPVALLPALAARWRTGVPLLITGGCVPAPPRPSGEPDLPLAVRTILRRFRRAVLHLGYAEADLVAPMSDYQRAWALRHGASPARVVVVPAGVAPRPAAIADPPVVVHEPEPGEPPYRLIQAMMSGCAVIGVDVHDVAETLGDAGILVPAGDPGALATARAALLGHPQRRRRLAAAARARASARFTAAGTLRVYDALYTDLAGPRPAPAYELTLAVPAPARPASTAVFGCPPTRP